MPYDVDETYVVDLLYLIINYDDEDAIIRYIEQYYTEIVDIDGFHLTLRLCHRGYFEEFFHFCGMILTSKAWRQLYWLTTDYVDELEYTGCEEPLFGPNIELWEPRRMLSIRPEIVYGKE